MFSLRRQRMGGGLFDKQSAASSRRRSTRRLAAETLESRLLLTTYYPTVFDDGLSGGTLRQAVVAANANPGEDTIVLSAGTYRLSIAPGSTTGVENDATKGDLDSNGTLTIRGAGRDATVIDAQNLDRVLHNFSYLVLQDLTLTRGSASSLYEQGGGAIASVGDLALVNCRLDGNVAHEYGGHGGYGGAIQTSGSLSLTNTLLSNNHGDISGAVIYSTYTSTFQTQTLQNCTFTGNNTTNSIPPGTCISAQGGSWSIVGTTFDNNAAGCVYATAGTWNVSGSTFSNNLYALSVASATIADSSFTSTTSGCSDTVVASGALVVSRSSFSGNIGAPTFSPKRGGALWIGTPTGTQITDCTFSGNSGYDGGAIYGLSGVGTILRCVFSANNATNAGGAIYGSGSITDCQFTGNTASATTAGGGAIYTVAATTVNRSTFSANHTGGKGGAIDNLGELTLSSSTFSGNSATGGGGALFTKPRVIAYPPSPPNDGTYDPQPYFALLTNCTFSGNSTSASGGGVLVEVTDHGYAADPQTKNTIIAGNSATTAGPDICGPFSSQGNNLIGKSDGGTGFTHGVNGDQVGSSGSPLDPKLGPLRNNGGPTQTLALLSGSPAIDAGNSSGAPATDQRGFARILDGNGDSTATIDIGAYEYRRQATTCGVYDPGQSKFYLKFTNSEGGADLTFGFGVPGWKPVAGDWNGDGRDTIGLFQPEAAHFYLRNTNSSGNADVNFGYGDPSQGDQYVLVMGDWNGDGVDTIGLYHKASAAWFLRNTNSEGMADLTFGFGVPGSTWVPLVGDWNGDGVDTIGLYDPTTGMFYLRNSHSTGMADIAFPYGSPGSGWTPLIGDWDGDGLESAGFYQPGAASHFYLRNSFTAGMADVHFGLGFAGVQPIVGDWLGPSGQPLLAAGVSAASAERGSLSDTALQPIVAEAIARWAIAGVSSSQLTAILRSGVSVADLPDTYLAQVENGQILIDRDAAGHGWFIDSTPAVDEEFTHLGAGAQLQAVDAQAVDTIDLLTVIEHELGHIAGLGDLDPASTSLMSGTLPTGVRRLVNA